MEKNKKNEGFTLVEVLVAITIMALTGGILLSSFTVAIKLNARAEREYEDCQQAQVVMEKLLCSDDLKKAVGKEITAKVTENATYLSSLTTEEIAVSKDTVKEDVPEITKEQIVFDKVTISEYSSAADGKQSVVCTITVKIEDDNHEEVYQLTGKRRIQLNGILGT